MGPCGRPGGKLIARFDVLAIRLTGQVHFPLLNRFAIPCD
jgi:hypothetical protein